MTGKPVTYDHLRSKKKAITTRVLIPLDSDLADEYNEAKQEFERAKLRANAKPDDAEYLSKLDQAEARFNDVHPRMEEESVWFVFKSLGRKSFEKILLAHPPSADQIAQAKAKKQDDPTWNGDTFPPALVAASLVEPVLSEEEVQALWDDDDWSAAELSELFFAALNVNSSRRTINLGKG